MKKQRERERELERKRIRMRALGKKQQAPKKSQLPVRRSSSLAKTQLTVLRRVS